MNKYVGLRESCYTTISTIVNVEEVTKFIKHHLATITVIVASSKNHQGIVKLVAKIFTLRLRCIQDQWKNMN